MPRVQSREIAGRRDWLPRKETRVFIEKLGAGAGAWRSARQVLQESMRNFFKENSLMVSASIAYHSLLSIFPFLLLLLGVGGIMLRHYEFTWLLALALERYLPMKPDFIMRNLVGISRAYGRLSIVSFLLLLWSSSGVFLPLEKALNRAWEVERGRSWWIQRLLALEMALILGILVIVSSGLIWANVSIHNIFERRAFHHVRGVLDFAYHASTFSMALAMFLILFERLPHRPMRFREVFPSALLTAIFWEGARSLFTLLLPLFNYRQVYGSIGVVVALMTWAYISSAVILFGAEVSRSLYRTLKLPAPSAQPIPSPADVL